MKAKTQVGAAEGMTGRGVEEGEGGEAERPKLGGPVDNAMVSFRHHPGWAVISSDLIQHKSRCCHEGILGDVVNI